MIEKMDKSRYDLVKWFLFGWAIWFGGFILKDLVSNKLILGSIVLLGLIGWIIFFVSLIKYMNLAKVVNSDMTLKNALNDEYMLHNRNKSFITGYWSVIIMTAAFIVLSLLTNITALIACQIILYIGVIAVLASSLIYNKA